jgi:hypothetical protein
VRTGGEEVGDRLHVFYRFRVNRRDHATSIVEQGSIAEDRITAIDLVCSGFRPECGQQRDCRHEPVR